jgi:hypothetical protein
VLTLNDYFILNLKFGLMAVQIIVQGSQLTQLNGNSLQHLLFKWVG